MDLINNLLQPNAPFKRIIVPGAEVDGALNIPEEDIGELHEVVDEEMTENYSYARVYQEKEAATYMEAAKRMVCDGSMNVSDCRKFKVTDESINIVDSYFSNNF